LELLSADFAARLRPFAAALGQMRADIGRPLRDPALYDALPCAPALQGDPEWRLRCRDLQIVKRLLLSVSREPYSVSRIPYSVSRIPYSVSRVPYSVSRIPYSVFRVPYSVFRKPSEGAPDEKKEDGLRTTDNGLRTTDDGLRTTDNGLRITDNGLRITDNGLRTTDNGLRNTEYGSRPPALRILDVGAYNGWLSHQLARLGHDVTGVEYFRDPFDGLGARPFYTADWRAVQMDLADLSLLAAPYDVVVMNHGLHFFPDPVGTVAQLLQKVAPGGLFVAIGLHVWRDPRRRQAQLAAAQAAYRQRYGREMLLRPARGYLDETDRARLAGLGLTLRPYPHFWLRNLLARLVPTRPWRGYAVARRASTSA
ncbi:MAG: class I SAM-dependent methyltransferase, partial [Anaerolineales bacterium]|nr:class I SAM-dependent methyltransferase [Anaerolineales bacterium]